MNSTAKSPLDVLSEVTGLKKPDMDKIFLEVKANKAKLEACPRHEFSIPIDRRTKKPLSGPVMFCDWECKNCHGRVDVTAKAWYERGMKHAA